MCGRFDKHTTNDWIARQCFGRALSGPESSPRYNVAPGTAIDAVTRVDTETVYISPMHWGFRPAGLGRKDSPAPINARAETVAGRGTLRTLFPASAVWCRRMAGSSGRPRMPGRCLITSRARRIRTGSCSWRASGNTGPGMTPSARSSRSRRRLRWLSSIHASPWCWTRPALSNGWIPSWWTARQFARRSSAGIRRVFASGRFPAL